MRLFRYCAFLAFVSPLFPLDAAPSVVVTMASVGDRVRAENPDLAAARWRIREALGRHEQSGRLSNPELDFEFEGGTGLGERRASVGISQRFPVTSRLELEKRVTGVELRAATAEVDDVARRLVAEARAAVVEVLAVRARRDLLEKQAELNRELAETIKRAAEKGEASLLDAGQARVEAMRVAAEARGLDAREAEALGRLKPLLGMGVGGRLVVSGGLPAAELPAAGADPERRPDYQMAKLGAEAAAQGVSLEEAQRHEDVEAGVFVAGERAEDAPDGYEGEVVAGIRLSVPLPLWNKNEGAIGEAKARHERMKLETVALGRAIRMEAEAALGEMREWSALVAELGDELLPLAREQAELEAEAWHNGQTDLESVLRARAQVLELAGSRLDALRDFHLARVRWMAAGSY